MSTSVTPAYYMMMIGSSLTIVTAVIMIIPNSINSYYGRFLSIYAGFNLATSFFLTLLPALACVFLSHLYYTRPPTRLAAGLLITALSIVSLVGVVGSGVAVYEGVVFSGPPISFIGGIIGAFLSKTTA